MRILLLLSLACYTLIGCEFVEMSIIGVSASNAYGCGGHTAGFHMGNEKNSIELRLDLHGCSVFSKSVQDSIYSESILVNNALYSTFKDTINKVDYFNLYITHNGNPKGRGKAEVNITALKFYNLSEKLHKLSLLKACDFNHELNIFQVEKDSDVMTRIGCQQLEDLSGSLNTPLVPLCALQIEDSFNPTIYLFDYFKYSIAYY